MNIAIVGLGLIGGSLAKAIKKNTAATVFGHDLDTALLTKAKSHGAIDEILSDDSLPTCEIVILAIYPEATVEYIKKQRTLFNKKAVLIDCCGVKRYICQNIEPIAKEEGFTFIGGHPMAGLEVAGYENSFAELYNDASMILTPVAATPPTTIEEISQFFLSLGFGHIEITTAENHDKNIAYTSQLAHVVSNAYVKSPSAAVHKGFSAGSYKDLTRVAKLAENMWTELFLENNDYLLEEIELIRANLKEYAIALQNKDEPRLKALLKDGRHRKEEVD